MTISIDALHDRYRRGFAGRSRSTRDLAALDAIIADAEGLSATLSGPERATLDERLSLYRTERTEIAAIQQSGPEALAAWRTVEWSRVSHARYLRAFAGQSRLTRDLALLQELAAEERQRLTSFPSTADARLSPQRDQIASNADLYAREADAIAAARRREAPAEQARLLATLANAQFAAYRAHFQGQSRATRREGALVRIVGALETIASQMSAVRDLGIRSEAHLSNLSKVNERVSHFKGELEKIRAARLTVSPDALARSLGDDANRVFAAYRAEFAGKDRTVVDLGRLGELCDALHEIVRTMQPLAGDTNARNVAVVLDQLSSFEREHARIRAARASAA